MCDCSRAWPCPRLSRDFFHVEILILILFRVLATLLRKSFFLLKFLHVYCWFVFLIGVRNQVASIQGHTRL